MKKIITVIFFAYWLGECASHSTLFAQDMLRVRHHIDTLAGASFWGRGYTFEGNQLAAQYIAAEFRAMDLQSYTPNYTQPFTLDVNTFPQTPQFSTTTQQWQAGRDFIVGAASQSGKGTGEVYWLDSLFFASPLPVLPDLRQKVVAYESKYEKNIFSLPKSLINNILMAKCLLKSTPKLTMSVANADYLPPTLELRADHAQNLKNGTWVNFEIKNQLLKNYSTQNVVGYLKGQKYPDSLVVFSAHYDHLGSLGKEVVFWGANDNASGVSMLVELARHYVQHPPAYSIAFIAFGAEEAGLLGSKYFVENPLFDLKTVKLLINLDLVGTGNDGLGIVNATVFPQQFRILEQLNVEKKYFSHLLKRGKAANSDHYFFTEKGVPSFFIYGLGGIQAYHDTDDKAATLPLTKYKEIFELLTLWVAKL